MDTIILDILIITSATLAVVLMLGVGGICENSLVLAMPLITWRGIGPTMAIPLLLVLALLLFGLIMWGLFVEGAMGGGLSSPGMTVTPLGRGVVV